MTGREDISNYLIYFIPLDMDVYAMSELSFVHSQLTFINTWFPINYEAHASEKFLYHMCIYICNIWILKIHNAVLPVSKELNSGKLEYIFGHSIYIFFQNLMKKQIWISYGPIL